jgi:cytochrome c
MTFAGISNDKQRADVIAYLDTLSPNPVPLPKPQAETAPPSAPGAGSGQPVGAPASPPPASDGTAPGNH